MRYQSHRPLELISWRRFATLAPMPMTLGVTAESDHVYVTASGEFSLDEAQRTFVQLLESVARFKRTKVLFDGRMLVGEPKMIERFYYAEFVAWSVASFANGGLVTLAPRFAYVLEEPMLDPERFGETVAVNRGMRVRAFDNLEAARAWLELAP